MGKTEWLWPRWIRRGDLSMISGPPGTHTATLAAWLAKITLAGGSFPDGAHIESDSNWQILWVPGGKVGELRKRFKRLGTPLERVLLPVKPDDEPARVDLTDPVWHRIIVDSVSGERPLWAIVDGFPSNSSEITPAVTGFIGALQRVTEKVGCVTTILCEHIEFGLADAFQTVLTISPWARGSSDLRLAVTQTIGACPQPVRIRIDGGIPSVVQVPVRLPKTAVDRATAYLEERLANGPQPAARLIASAEAHEGFSRRSLQRAKKRLQLRCYLRSRRWWWAFR